MNDRKLEEQPEYSDIELKLINFGFVQSDSHNNIWNHLSGIRVNINDKERLPKILIELENQTG